MSIPFTQFLRPNGERRQVSIELAPAVEAKAHRIINEGDLSFEIEELRNGTISATISSYDEDLAYAPFVPNGPRVPEAIIKLIEDFDLEDYLERKAANG